WETRNTDSEQDQSLPAVSAVKRPYRLSIDLSTLPHPSMVPPPPAKRVSLLAATAPPAKRVSALSATPSATVHTSVGHDRPSRCVATETEGGDSLPDQDLMEDDVFSGDESSDDSFLV
ncbi:hypothetical protein KIPB_017147, partial [Kipferlia bialata]